MAIAKVILNGDTLMDVTSNTVTSETLKEGYTATGNDGSSITGEYVPKLLVKEEILEDAEQIYAAGDVVVLFESTSNVQAHNNTSNASFPTLKLKNIDSNKEYIIQGQITIIDSNDNTLDIIEINDTLNSINDTTKQPIYINNNNYISSIYMQWRTANSNYAQIGYNYKQGTFGLKISLVVKEKLNNYDGLAAITVKVGGKYGIYRCIAERLQPLTASGSTSYGYTATDISNWCNSFSFISKHQLEDINFSGSFYFNNVSYIDYYGLARIYYNMQTGTFYYPYFYFPQLISINELAFTYNNLQFISAPNCTIIKSSAFSGCAHLSDVNFPNCSIIGYYAFYNAGVVTASFSNCSLISSQAFERCVALTTVYFPECLSISTSAFNYCIKLSSIYFPKCTFIASSAFGYCSDLTSADFPECSIINSAAFGSCIKLNTISFPECTTIAYRAFYGCTSLTTAEFPKCTLISYQAFYSCDQLTTINFSVCDTIGTEAFGKCLALSSVTLPVCEIINTYAFNSCINLSTISLPACTEINQYAFQYCYNLLSLYLMGSSYVSLLNANAFNQTPISTYTTSTNGVYGSIYVPSSMLDTYISMTNWSKYSSRFVGI